VSEKREVVENICPAGDDCGLRRVVSELSEQIKVLNRLVLTDPLTGLHNYRHFSHSLDQEMERCRRSGQPCCLIMVDLDHFKQVNDSYGHEVGNQVLVQTAELIQNSLRKLDIACRYGGEEFILILPNTGLSDAVRVAERVREMIENKPLVLPGHRLINLSASLGVDIFHRQDSDTPEVFTARVDAQLYHAKESGRNRVCCSDRGKVQRRLEVTQGEKDVLSGLFDSE